MNYENRLLSKALSERDLSPLFNRGVTEKWFGNEEDKRVFVFVKEHFKKYSECPSEVVVLENYPTYKFESIPDSFEFLIDKVVEAKRSSIINNSMRGAIEEIELRQNPESAVMVFQRGIARLAEDGLSDATDVDLTVDTMTRWEEYLQRKNLPDGLLGLPTGFASIDKVTSGMQKGQLITIVAPPKTGKSTLALQWAHNVHKFGAVPMFQSFEMSNQEQLSRYDAMRSRLSHHRLITGTLTDDEESRYQAKLRSLETMRHKFWLTDSIAAGTITGIANKIQALQPDIVFIDGVYLMTDEQSGERNTPIALTNITRSLKRVAQQFQVPVVMSTQALTWKMKNGSVTADSIGYSSSFFQDSDVLYGLQREDENVDDTRLFKILGGRNVSPMEVSLLWDWNTGDFREISSEDL
jgi:replicative DNA helicase